MNARCESTPAHGPRWQLISLRPQDAHGPMRRAAARVGAGVIAVSPWRLETLDDAASRAQLARALQAGCIVFTSPAAVAAAARLAPLAATGGTVFAVGAGTARALRRHGVAGVVAPGRMDSEGLLALPPLASPRGRQVALVTAPGGRGVIAAYLESHGAELIRANVYQRVPLPLSPRTLTRLEQLQGPAVLALSSSEALERVWSQLPPALQGRWQQQVPVVAASTRLAELARGLGFARVDTAAGPMPVQLADAATRVATKV
ncbi:uroporphyrinogen-III synthase [Stenotrophomonas sp. Marseille-Q4652]|uniref:uroporphyrinogen-III synthase n=1 Tax=Stenotrophomonas sp. Marseille-Q4652 TaxID=2866595 RepID=UPI001CE405BC|nr:uroporphyrinogen-III synthase [Stenotrophomonas sp. Marseille-Q4652]